MNTIAIIVAAAALIAGALAGFFIGIAYRKKIAEKSIGSAEAEAERIVKEANAQAIRLQSRTTSLAAEYARQGKDWETELEQIAKEQKLMKQLGIAPEEAQPKNGKDEDED